MRGVLAVAIVGAAVVPAGQSPPPTQFTVLSGGHPLAVWHRPPTTPVRAAVVLVHGRTWSSRPDWDLQVDGPTRSVMQSLAARGVAAYAVDLRGYGATPRDHTGFITPTRAAADVAAVTRWVSQRHREVGPPALVGWSLGGAVIMLAAGLPDAAVSSLVVFGFVLDPDLKYATVSAPAEPAREKTTRADAELDFISPLVTPRRVVDAFVRQALESDPVRADWIHQDEFNAIRPERLTRPTLVIYGERDPGVDGATARRLLDRLGASRKQITVLPGGDHAAQLEDTHDAFVDAVAAFVTRPERRR